MKAVYREKKKAIVAILFAAAFFAGCQQKPIRYTPPPPIRALSKRGTMSPEAVARAFFERCLQKKAYRCFLSFASRRLLIEGPDKEHFLEALTRYPILQSKIVSARAESEGKKATVRFLLSGRDGEKPSSLKVFLVKESALWRVDRLSPRLPYISFHEIGKETK